ncbi:MAG: amidase [Alphaproteobacteria bacterium]|nr:amidase [Alphaproteobacteria bacterium]
MTHPLGTIASLSKAYKDGALTATESVAAHLDQIQKYDTTLGAYQSLFPDEAMQMASATDQAIRAGYRLGPLHGIPFALKDIFHLAGTVCTNGAKPFLDHKSTMTGTVVKRLIAAGGIILGKSKTVEHAFGGWGTNQQMGTPWNPWDMRNHRIPGGSSSGSAVATAAAMAVCGIGSDTGGSVRLPAGFCGLTGLKVTEAQLPCDGIMPLSQTLDTPGPITQTVTDAIILYEVMRGRAGADIDDDMSSGQGLFGEASKGVKGLRIGAIDDQERAHCSLEVLAEYDRVCDILKQLGATIEVISTPMSYTECADMNGQITAIEAYHNHGALYDDLSAPLDEDVRKRVLSGKARLADVYINLLQNRQQHIAIWLSSMAQYDALVTPSIATTAPKITDADQDTTPGHFTRPFNYLGTCGLSLPTGLSDAGLPFSLQVIGKPHDEAMCIRIGQSIEAAIKPIGRPSL